MRLDRFIFLGASRRYPRLDIRLSYKIWGGIGGGVTPLPIPNREVKPSCADGTARETGWESRSPPPYSSREPRVQATRGCFTLARPAPVRSVQCRAAGAVPAGANGAQPARRTRGPSPLSSTFTAGWTSSNVRSPTARPVPCPSGNPLADDLPSDGARASQEAVMKSPPRGCSAGRAARSGGDRFRGRPAPRRATTSSSRSSAPMILIARAQEVGGSDNQQALDELSFAIPHPGRRAHQLRQRAADDRLRSHHARPAPRRPRDRAHQGAARSGSRAGPARAHPRSCSTGRASGSRSATMDRARSLLRAAVEMQGRAESSAREVAISPPSS